MPQIYAIDTSIMVRLLTGHPVKEAQETVERLHQRYLDGQEFVASSMVVGESYIAVQHHFKISKPKVKDAILRVFQSKLLSPLEGKEVLNALKTATGAGLMDRLIAIQGQQAGIKTLTLDQKMSRLDDCELLK